MADTAGFIGFSYNEEKLEIFSPDSSIIAAAAAPGTPSSSVVFEVRSILRLSVAEHPLTEFLEEKDWQRVRKSSPLQIPCSTDGLMMDDDNKLKISETLALLRVPELVHQFVIERLRLVTAAISHGAGFAPKVFFVRIFEVTRIQLPLICTQGKAIYPADETYPPLPTEEEKEQEEIGQPQFIDFVKKIIVGTREINEEGEDALIQDWFRNLTDAIGRVSLQVNYKEWTCPVCREIFKRDEAWIEMRCCSQVSTDAIDRDAFPVTVEEKIPEEDEKEWTCPVCREIFKADKAWIEMRCCSQVSTVAIDRRDALNVTVEEKEANTEEVAKVEGDEKEEWTCPVCMEIFKPDKAWMEMRCCSQAVHFNSISEVKEEEEEKEKEEEEAKVEEEDRTCPICMEILFKPDEKQIEMKMPCCSQVFHFDCISKWTKRLKECPWCRSSLPLVLQSAQGLIHRLNSKHFYCPMRPGFHYLLVTLWHLLVERVWWARDECHDVGCKCGCQVNIASFG